MGPALSVLVPHLVLGTAGYFLMGKFGIVGGCSIPLLCEVGHAVADETVHHVGRHAVGDVVRDRLCWEVTGVGVRAYSLNFCGPLNYFFDFIRRLLSPLAFSFSGQMTHEVIVFTLRNPLDDCCKKAAYLLLCKCHSGDIIIDIFDTVEGADVIAKPSVFGAPKGAWWSRRMDSDGFYVRDVVDKVLLLPAVYRTVTDNCHHFVKEMWNWHITAKLVVATDRLQSEQRSLKQCHLKQIKWPRSGCSRRTRSSVARRKDLCHSRHGFHAAADGVQQSGSESLLSCSSASAIQDAE